MSASPVVVQNKLDKINKIQNPLNPPIGRKFDKDITVGLISSELLNLVEYNVHMAKLLDVGRNKAASEFSISLIQSSVINDSRAILELHNLVDALAKLAARPGSPESLQQLVEIARNPTASAAALSGITIGKEDTNAQSRNEKATGLSLAGREDYNVADLFEPDPAGFEQASMLFADCIAVISSSPHQLQPLSFLAIDIYAKLVFSIVKFCHADQGPSKLSLLHKVLVPIEKFFNLLAIFQIIHHPLLDLISLDHLFDGASFQVLISLANAFHVLHSPLSWIQFAAMPELLLFFHELKDDSAWLPVQNLLLHILLQVSDLLGLILYPILVFRSAHWFFFSFAWLELVSHRSFMPKLLTVNHQKGWCWFQCLLVDLFQFREPFLRNAELGESVHFLYKGTLGVVRGGVSEWNQELNEVTKAKKRAATKGSPWLRHLSSALAEPPPPQPSPPPFHMKQTANAVQLHNSQTTLSLSLSLSHYGIGLKRARTTKNGSHDIEANIIPEVVNEWNQELDEVTEAKKRTPTGEVHGCDV
ncbi:unnamed protein product [Ilex paraguariensis]|uniref:Uncharacterized protein n=1 Tax=Ilex paraguariensis TaxID=185542 RepID=A0ABC8V4W2_9AQUA